MPAFCFPSLFVCHLEHFAYLLGYEAVHYIAQKDGCLLPSSYGPLSTLISVSSWKLAALSELTIFCALFIGTS